MEVKILVLLAVLGVLFFIAKSYRHDDHKIIKAESKQTLVGDLEEHEAGLLVSLLAKVAKADGRVCELEAQLLKNTFNDISSRFENQEIIRESLKKIYEKEKESFDNTLLLCEKYFKLTKSDYQKRVKFLEYLLNMAFIDGDFGETEMMICEDIASAIEVKKDDYDRLVFGFNHFYENQAKQKLDSLDKAYEILESNKNDSFDVIKNNYRKLVKKNHPDIIQASGADQSIIDMATRRLQEINEAYELIKKDKNV